MLLSEDAVVVVEKEEEITEEVTVAVMIGRCCDLEKGALLNRSLMTVP